MFGIKKIIDYENKIKQVDYTNNQEIYNKTNVPNQDNLSISTNLFYEFINKPDILKSNARLWNSFLDKRLHEFVIIHNFDFYEIANRFQNVVVQPLKYYFNEDEIRKHWSFLYACRKINFVPEDTYYKNLKNKYDFEIKPQNFGETKSKNNNEIFENINESRDILINEINDEVPELEINVEIDNKVNSDKKLNEIEIINKKEKIENIEKVVEKNSNIENLVLSTNVVKEVKINEEIPNSTKLFYTTDYRPNTVKNKPLEYNINTKKEDSDDDEVFPINYEKAPMNNYNYLEENTNNNFVNIDDYENSLFKTKNFDEFVRENDKLKKQYDDINKYFTFAMKGISHLFPKNLEEYSENHIEDDINISIEDREKKYFHEMGKKINDYVQEAVKSDKLEDLYKDVHKAEIINDQNNDVFYSDIKLTEKIEDEIESNLTKNLDEFNKLEQNTEKMEKFRNFMFGNMSNLEGNSEDLLDNIMRLISSEETSNIRIRTDEEYNDTIDCSRNSFLISNENSNNNSTYLSNNDINELNKQNKQAYYYRGIQMKDKEDYDYDKDDSFIED